VHVVADLGEQPITNRFEKAGAAEPYRYRLSVAVCGQCGLVQLEQAPPAQEIIPRFDWISHREPEAHLDDLADRLASVEGLPGGSLVLGLGDDDRPLLDRLYARGLRTTIVDWREELGPVSVRAGTETLQRLLTPDAARAMAARHGRADLVIARSLVEHAHDVHSLLGALAELTTPDGYLFLETPDSEPTLNAVDPSVLWEEHTMYFTVVTLRHTIRRAGFIPQWSARPSGTTELDVLGKCGAVARATPSSSEVDAEIDRALQFGAGLTERRAQWRQLLADEKAAGRTAALFGAGHVGIMFVNVFGLGQGLSCAIDDHPEKRGLLIPGASLPIFPSTALGETAVDTILLALSPEAEERVVESLGSWRDGGTLLSIFPGSPRYPTFEGT
jgi:hypothetical protein